MASHPALVSQTVPKPLRLRTFKRLGLVWRQIESESARVMQESLSDMMLSKINEHEHQSYADTAERANMKDKAEIRAPAMRKK